MVYNILIVSTPIPSNTIGSWNVMLTNLVDQNLGLFDYIISPKTHRNFEQCTHLHIKKSPFTKPLSKLYKYYSFKCYYNPLRELLKKEGDFVINIIDNTGMLSALNYFLNKDGFRKRVKIIYHFHGFALNVSSNAYFDNIDTLILLTNTSYKWQMNNTHAMACKVRQIYNGVDSNKFHKVTAIQKKEIKKRLGMDENKLYFLWLSQDRPKKGLHIILEAWQKIISVHSDIELVIVGIPARENSKQISYLGQFSNDQLPQYYQASDFFLFSTLCHEGHPLALTEALKCGAICLASNIDPVSEVMADGKYGRLVDFPNDPASWIAAVLQEIDKCKNAGHTNIYEENMPELLYDATLWMQNIKAVMEEEMAGFA